MDEAARPVGTSAVADTNGSRDPQEIRREIEQTREELADTAAALAQKADVKGRAKEKVAEIKSTVGEKTGEVRSTVADATPASAATAAGEAKTATTNFARERPLPVAVGAGVLAGLLLGYLIASHRR